MIADMIPIEDLDNLSCTDVKCVWSHSHKETLEKYKATRVRDHECFSQVYRSCDFIKLREDQITMIKNVSLHTGENAFTKHM